ncbi:MAG: IS4 family transposase [Desulfobacterales bacterium]|uniref:IS4 family transposase n=1 Tax=Candidatus Desulfatibia vada TaxID=2841696 RepID=A0A8J6P088_9BACT|nr:IS4 family transposase [Candidatus Desulfatibia vada]
MTRSFEPYQKKHFSPSFYKLYQPVVKILPETPVLESRGDRPLQMTFEDELKALIFFHLEEHNSGRHLIQVFKEDDFARKNIAPEDGIEKSSFFEAINTRGLEQLEFVFQKLSCEASNILPNQHPELGELVAFDGSLIDAVLSMTWADYRKGSKKAKVHIGFDLNRSIPRKIFLTDGDGSERPFVNKILSPGQTGVGDRGYQKHALFDSLQAEGKSFVIRIKAGTTKTLIKEHKVNPGSIVFYDAEVLLGTVENNNQTENSVRLVGYRVDGVDYWVATDRRDLTAEQIAKIYKLRWQIENFFAWWKRHLRVYHLIARSEYGLMVQILGGLITYLLLAIYCHTNHKEPVSIKRVRQLRIQIQNELRDSDSSTDSFFFKEQKRYRSHART